MKISSLTVIFGCFTRVRVKLIIFLRFEIGCPRSYVLAIFISFSVVAAILYIMAKLKARFYARSLGIELNVMTIL